MSDKIIIDENICDCFTPTKEDEEGAYPIVNWCVDNNCKCDDVPFDECLIKAVQYCKLKDKQLKRKEQECEKHAREADKYKRALKEIKCILSARVDFYINTNVQAPDAEMYGIYGILKHKLKQVEKILETISEVQYKW